MNTKLRLRLVPKSELRPFDETYIVVRRNGAWACDEYAVLERLVGESGREKHWQSIPIFIED